MQLHPPLSVIFTTSLVFLAFCGLLLGVGVIVELVAAPSWLRAAVLLSLRTAAFVEFLGFLEELVEVELPDDVFLIEGPRYRSPFVVHHRTSHNFPSSLEKHQRRQLLGQRGGTDPVPVQK